MSQNDIQRNKLRYLESRNLDHFHSIGNKHIKQFLMTSWLSMRNWDIMLESHREGLIEKTVYGDEKSVKSMSFASAVSSFLNFPWN